ncbi:MAG: cupin domain-containing protein [Boseongicola sp. SB0662_bin_57]|nr:cupin domain-containing protein [Boseongicola sp. SB0662_bin_57]
MDADEVIACYGLEPHPEGGHYRETFRAPAADGGREAVSAIYYFLKAGETSAWHRIDAVEIWHHHAGAPLRLALCSDGMTVTRRLLGTGGAAEPQAVVPAGCWQSAVSLGEWTLVGCTVAPAFEFSGFELASPEWRPGLTPA